MGTPRIRSRLLSAGSSAAGGTIRLLKLGEQSSVIVKSLYFDNRSTAATPIEVYAVQRPEGPLTALLRESPEAHTPVQWNGWAVLESDDELVADIGASGVFWWVSGTLLSGTIDTVPLPLGVGALPALLGLRGY